jgi:hypothetical protein
MIRQIQQSKVVVSQVKNFKTPASAAIESQHAVSKAFLCATFAT